MNIHPAKIRFVDFGRIVCNGDEAFRREWLVTNGIGGYASGTVGGVRTRKYHATLIAATTPPPFGPFSLEKLRQPPCIAAFIIRSVQINGKMDQSRRRDTFGFRDFILRITFPFGVGRFLMHYWNAESS